MHADINQQNREGPSRSLGGDGMTLLIKSGANPNMTTSECIPRTGDQPAEPVDVALLAAAVRAHRVELTPELAREIDLGLIGVPEEEQAAALDALFEGPAADCRSCTHPEAGSVEHDYADGAWWHDITVGEIPVVANDLPLHVAVLRLANSPAGVDISSKGWGEIVQLDLAGVREAIRVLQAAELLLAIEVTEGGQR